MPVPRADERLVSMLRAPSANTFSGLDEQALADLAAAAVRHRVAPLVLRSLRTGGVGTPDGLLHPLRDDALKTARRNLRRWQALGHVLDSLVSGGIPVLVLKGAHLAELVYGDVGLRPMRDVDLLVPRDRLPEVDARLRGLGLEPGEWNGPFYARTHFHFAYHDAAGHNVEVHWHLVPPDRTDGIDLDGVWARSLPATIGGCPVRVMCREDLLLHVALHLVTHEMSLGLLAVCDVDAVLRATGTALDWTTLRHRAAQWGGIRALSLTLWLSRELMGTPLPVAVDGWLDAAVPRDIASVAKRLMLDADPLGPREPRNPNLRRLAAASGLRARAGVVLRAIFAPRDMVAEKYRPVWPGRAALPLAYVVRIADLMRRYGRHALARLASDAAGPARDTEVLLAWVRDGRPRVSRPGATTRVPT